MKPLKMNETSGSAKKSSIVKVLIISTALSFFLVGCGQTPVKTTAEGGSQSDNVDDLYIVDCLLPAQVRRLGSMSYLGPRRPTRTTTIDCEIRGGEYVAYDRSDYRAALKVWLEQAELGDAKAQNYVGEIFEKGLGQAPDYISAGQWYRKAADQGDTRAMINLGYLYEKGLGVEKNLVKALNLYRQSSGLDTDELVLDSQARAQIASVKDELTKKLSAADIQSRYLSQQIASLESKLNQVLANDTQAELDQAKAEIAALTQLYENAEKDKSELADQLNGVTLAYRNIQETPLLRPEQLVGVDERQLKKINFGRYFAVLIGNQDYYFLEDLRSPKRDTERLKKILEEQYGFSVLMLPDADEKSILNALNDLAGKLTPNDNLLVYYAGHGEISQSESISRERAYWLPVDARRESISNWINNSVITDHLDRIQARSVLVVADSCFAGQLGIEGSPFLFGSGGRLSENSIKSGLKHRSRVVISSGGTSPVLDGTVNDHSVFAGSLLDVLESNTQILRDSMVFSQIAVNVRERNLALGEGLASPEMKPIRSAGHEGGVFYFVPNN